MVKLITDNILDLTPDFWLKVGDKIHDWVLDDCRAGIMQNNTSGHAYKSEWYKKYKANEMRKFGRTERISLNIMTKKGTRKRITVDKKPGRLKGYETVPIVSTQINPVNMILTQRTINSLHPKASTKDSVTMAFAPDKTGLLNGNRDRGYDIIGLNDKNREQVKQKILNQFDENIRKTIAPTIIIEVS